MNTTNWHCYQQCNSGGYFSGPRIIAVAANTIDAANDLAVEHGVDTDAPYCECCGPRWWLLDDDDTQSVCGEVVDVLRIAIYAAVYGEDFHALRLVAHDGVRDYTVAEVRALLEGNKPRERKMMDTTFITPEEFRTACRASGLTRREFLAAHLGADRAAIDAEDYRLSDSAASAAYTAGEADVYAGADYVRTAEQLAAEYRLATCEALALGETLHRLVLDRISAKAQTEEGVDVCTYCGHDAAPRIGWDCQWCGGN